MGTSWRRGYFTERGQLPQTKERKISVVITQFPEQSNHLIEAKKEFRGN
jgi:hypothetical protein